MSHVHPLPAISPQGPLQRNTHIYDLMRQCIHCGFCLPTCPTYAVLGTEMDSPRGRIYQIQAVTEGRMPVTNDFVEHMYCCLGCRACETACPSGVQFGKLVEAAREQIQLEDTIRPIELSSLSTAADNDESSRSVKRPVARFAEHALRRFFFDTMLPSRQVTSLVFAGLKMYQRSGIEALVHKTGLLDLVNALPTPFQNHLKVPEELMHQARGDLLPKPLTEITPALGPQRYRVGLISGCIMDQVFRDINEATIRVLTANGCEVITPVNQQCCGALHVHAGEGEQGRLLARQNIDVFEPYNCDAIIINSAGCGSNCKEYGHLLRDDPAYAARAQDFSQRVKDVSEFLASLDWHASPGELPVTVAYHDACHLAHGQKIKKQPRQLLQSIPALKMVELKEADWCCGSAGIYNITNQEMASTLLERKMQHILASGANVLATGNPGCMMQIALGARERGMEIRVVHPIQLLDEAYRAGELYTLPSPERNGRQLRQSALLAGLGLGIVIGLTIVSRQRKKNK